MPVCRSASLSCAKRIVCFQYQVGQLLTIIKETHIECAGHLIVQLLGDLLVHVQLPVLVLVDFQLFQQLILARSESRQFSIS